MAGNSKKVGDRFKIKNKTMKNEKMMVFGTQKRAGQWYFKCFDCGEVASFLEFVQTHQCPASQIGMIAGKPRRTKQTKSRAAAVKAKLRYKVGSKMEVGKSKK